MAKRGTYQRTEEHKKITSEGLKRFYANGGQVWSKGKKFSEKHRMMLSVSHLGKTSKKAIPSICCYCNSSYYKKDGGSRRKNRKYCSFDCFNKARVGKRLPPRFDNRGPLNNNWNGGSSRSYKTGYWSTEYKYWRQSVFERDDFTCQGCFKRGCYLTSHHIKSWRNYPELRFEISSGQTLCEDCHSKTDNYKHKAKLETRK